MKKRTWKRMGAALLAAALVVTGIDGTGLGARSLSMTAQAESANLLSNGDMGDDGVDLWDKSGNCAWKFNDWTALSSANYSTDAAYGDTSKGVGLYFGNADGSAPMYQTISSLEAGTYTLSGYTKETNGLGGSVALYTNWVTSTEQVAAISTDKSWSQFSLTFTLDEAVTNYAVGVTVTASKGAWVCLDTLSLVKKTAEDEAAERSEAIVSLKSLVAECKALTESAYTAESYENLLKVLNASETFVTTAESDSTVTTEEIKAQIAALTGAKEALVPASMVQSSIFVKQLSLSDDFIKGVDVSSYVSEKQSGVTYYDYDKTALDDAGFFRLLAESGVNWVRIRVWNNPYDANGNGYGGGNNDIDKAVTIGELATNAGLKVLIDFHYSDFWADPAKQDVPKAWASMTVDEKVSAVSTFTTESLNKLHAAGVDVRMVQIGNETNNGICGESDWTNRAKIYNAGASAVRAYEDSVYGSDKADGSEVMVALHFTEPNTGIQSTIASNLSTYDVDYDVFATSYYPFWHGTLANLNSTLSAIASTYGKKVMVAETSYAYTYEDGDGHENNVRADKASSLTLDYNISVQGQADAVSNVMETIGNTTNGIGMFYWEPAWIPVQVYDATAENAAEVLASNQSKWEQYGSGWAASYSVEYDPEDAGRYYGGSSWDNQALFDQTGHPLESLRVFKYVSTGATTSVRADVTKSSSVIFTQGETYTLPATVTVVNNDGTKGEESVTWDAAAVAALGEIGSYTISGVSASGLAAVCNVEILPPENLLKNGSFEDGLSDGNGWTIANDTNGLIKLVTENMKSGTYALKFDAWSKTADGITITQTVENLSAGLYSCFMNVEGASDAGTYTIALNAWSGEEAGSATAELAGWLVWDKVEVSKLAVEEGASVTVQISILTEALETWGTIDDVYLYRVGDLPGEDQPAEDQPTVEIDKEATVDATAPTETTKPTTDSSTSTGGSSQASGTTDTTGTAGTAATNAAATTDTSATAQATAPTAPKTADASANGWLYVMTMVGCAGVFATKAMRRKKEQ